ncbi:MAG: UPF0175 family protein [Candidatus Desulfofervidus sp.]|nr:UPF0175 family protein [Candidatus Desulfofervidus sp.]
MPKLQVKIPNDIFAIFHMDHKDMSSELFRVAVVKWYELGLLSQEKSAEVLSLSRSQFIDLLSHYKVCPIQLNEEELDQELADE